MFGMKLMATLDTNFLTTMEYNILLTENSVRVYHAVLLYSVLQKGNVASAPSKQPFISSAGEGAYPVELGVHPVRQHVLKTIHTE